MNTKLKLAIASVILGIVLFLLSSVAPQIFYSNGELMQNFFSLLNIFSVFGTVPYFITILRNKNPNQNIAESIPKNNEVGEATALGILKHIGIRLGIIVLLSVLVYVVILNGRSDSMGLGAIYAALAAAGFSIIGLIADCIYTYKKENLSSRFYSSAILLCIIAFLLFSFLTMS